MLRRFSLDFSIFSIFLDASIIAASLLVTQKIRPALSALPIVEDIPAPYAVPAILLIVFPVAWITLLFFSSVYDGRRNLRFWREIASLSMGSLLSVIALAGMLFLSFREVSRFFYLTFTGLAYTLMLFWRTLLRLAYHYNIIKSVQEHRILILGAGVLGREVERQITSYRSLGYSIRGFLDDDQEKQRSFTDILGKIADTPNIIRAERIDDIIIALPPSAHEKVFELVAHLQTVPLKVWVIPDYFKVALYKTSLEEFAGIPMLDLRAPALTETQRLIKRGFDIIVVLIFLPIALPLMAIIALLLWLSRSGPVFFIQPRVGENGKIFSMIKFRTMRTPVPEDSGANSGQLNQPKRSEDPRITRIGRFLRRSSLDELPQLFNVLVGSMSLVGPRPELPELVKQYDAWQYKRFAVPQGLTGWWQVNGRAERSMQLHTEDDLYYIRNYSVFLDINIILKTIGAVVRGRGAY